MIISDYASLQSSVLSVLNRSNDGDAATYVTMWIQLAEVEIAAEVARWPIRHSETVDRDFTIDAETVDIPDGMIKLRGNIKINGDVTYNIEYRSFEELNRLGLINSVNGKPCFYTLEGDKFKFSPAPDSAYSATIIYTSLPSLSDSNTTNWMLTNFPNVYLHATLAQAERFFRDDSAYTADTQIWKSLYESMYAAYGAGASSGSLQMRTDNGNP